MHIVKTRRQAGRGATLTPWSAGRLTILAVSLCVAVDIVDALLGRHAVLIGLLIVGPCCATLTRRWRRIALVGAWSVALAVVLGFPDVNFGSSHSTRVSGIRARRDAGCFIGRGRY
jgi:hypothetical protein